MGTIKDKSSGDKIRSCDGGQYHYGWQKLFEAVICLTGKSPQSERLHFAAMCLMHITPEKDLPESMHEKFERLGQMILEGREVMELSEKEIDEAYSLILNLYAEILYY